jgi:uncharacterized protein (UPF0332 family)
MSAELARLLRERKLLRIRTDRKMVLKEIEGASYDLTRARRSLDDDDAKWAIVKAYYAMFHAARALLFSRGFREKSHRALLAALRELFRTSIDPELFDAFEDGMAMREEADYSMTYSEESASELVENAQRFLLEAKRMLKIED